MYKWPQGKIIRTVGAILALVVAFDLAYNGSYGQLDTYYGGATGTWQMLVVGWFFALVAAVALFGGLYAVAFHKRAVDFLIEVEQEMIRVTWPSSRDLVRSTVFIAVMIAVLAGGIIVVDLINRGILNLVFGVQS